MQHQNQPVTWMLQHNQRYWTFPPEPSKRWCFINIQNYIFNLECHMLKDLNIRPPDLMTFGHPGGHKEGNGSDIDICQMAQQIIKMYGPCATILS